MAQLGEVVFALERFELSADERLEVVGRWQGLEGRRMGRPVLTVVESGGRRRRLNALPGGQLASTHAWRAAFAWDGDVTDIEGAELELGRRLVVELPAPRRRRRRSADEKRAPSQPTEAVAAVEPSRNGVAHPPDEALTAAQEEIRRLEERLRSTCEAIDERDARLMALQAAADRAADEATSRVDAERAEAADLRTKLAEAREEAERARQEATAALAAEAAETERLRQELRETREESERAVAAERTETIRLREALAAREAAADEAEEDEAPGRRLLEKANRDVERERATNRTLRRELEAMQAEVAELRRAAAVTPPTAEQPGMLRPGTAHRLDVARAAGAHLVPDHHPSPARLWATRIAAALVVAVLLAALALILAPLL